jgi:O-methyltransferase involved in polyketide biosynthesis
VTRDYSTISPSAKGLVMVRSQSGLPFAREAAVRMYGEAEVRKVHDDITADQAAYLKMRHFEIRSRSIDRALAARGATLVLELAAGLSFRGLAMAERAGICYADTDLPDMIATKRELAVSLHPAPLAGDYRLCPLDAMDGPAVRALVATLPPGPLHVVNEGLLVYLDGDEKTRLFATILELLKERGGAWITADIYIPSAPSIARDAATREFLDRHHVDANKFASYADAEAFVAARGFAIAAREPSSRAPDHPRETWTLVAA